MLEQYIRSSSWYGHVDNDFFLVDNPRFIVERSFPYKADIVMGCYCRRGSLSGSINLNAFNLTPGSFVVSLPNQIMTYGDCSDDFDGTYIFFSNAFFSDFKVNGEFFLRSLIQRKPVFEASERFTGSVGLYFSACRRVIQAVDNPFRLEILQHITKAFFLGVSEDLHPDYEKQTTPSLFNDFARLVERHYREHRDVKFYADRLCRSEKHVSTVIKAATGITPLGWIERYVILDAKSQLASTDRTIKQIAADLNFPDISAFGKYFTRIVGMSPTAYRREALAPVR